MELETAKLVAFALWAESESGVSGKSPEELTEFFKVFHEADDIEGLLTRLTPDLDFKLDNYLTVWEAAEEPDKAFDELESASSEEQKETPAEEVDEIPRPYRPDLIGVMKAEEKETPQPKKQRGKRGR